MTEELRKLAKRLREGQTHDFTTGYLLDQSAVMDESADAIDALLDRLEAAEKDAERYRLHREVGGQIWHLSGTRTRATGEYFDFATDEILAKQLEASK